MRTFHFPDGVPQCLCLLLALSQSDADLYAEGVRLCECPDGKARVLCPSCQEWANCWSCQDAA